MLKESQKKVKRIGKKLIAQIGLVTQAESEHYKRQLQHVQAESEHYKRQLQHVQAESEHYKRQLQHVQAESEHYKRQLQHVQAELEQLKTPASDFSALRKSISTHYLAGSGIEIGPLHQPLKVPPQATVRYVDRMRVQELKQQYPELSHYNLVEPDIIDDGETLASINDNSVDFVIANHMIEQCQNPIATLENFLRVLKPDGILYMAVPDKRYSFDCDRSLTPLEHLVRDYQDGPAWSKHSHFEEYTRLVDKVPDSQVDTHLQALIDRDYSIHFHVWTDATFLQLLLYCRNDLSFPFEIELLQKNDFEFILVLKKTLSSPCNQVANIVSPAKNPQILDEYIKSAPSQQNAINIFKGEWASKLPERFASLEAGQLHLFEDKRLEWGIKQLGGVADKHILELGPLEAGHTYMMEQMGAASITSVEANTRAYLKCLIIKEIMTLRGKFLCGDFVEYLRNHPSKFDICIASGVLYHVANPVEMINLIAKASDKVFFWTHYYDREIISSNFNLAHKFTSSICVEHDGFKHKLYRQEYKTALDAMSFCGGSNSFSHWMSRQDILYCLESVGFSDIQINFDEPEHPNGPSFAITAMRH